MPTIPVAAHAAKRSFVPSDAPPPERAASASAPAHARAPARTAAGGARDVDALVVGTRATRVDGARAARDILRNSADGYDTTALFRTF